MTTNLHVVKASHLSNLKLASALNAAGYIGTVYISPEDLEISKEIGAIRTKIAKRNNVNYQKYQRNNAASVDKLGVVGELVLQTMLLKSRHLGLGALLAAGAVKGPDFFYKLASYDVKGMNHECNELRVNQEHHQTIGLDVDYYIFFRLSVCATFARLYNIPARYISDWYVKPGPHSSPYYAANLDKVLTKIALDAAAEGLVDIVAA